MGQYREVSVLERLFREYQLQIDYRSLLISCEALLEKVKQFWQEVPVFKKFEIGLFVYTIFGERSCTEILKHWNYAECTSDGAAYNARKISEMVEV